MTVLIMYAMADHDRCFMAIGVLNGLAAADPFAKVREMIEDMIASLQKESKEEAQKKNYCDSEIQKSDHALKSTTQQMNDAVFARDEAEGKAAQADEEAKKLAEELMQMQADKSEADKMRATEKNDNGLQ